MIVVLMMIYSICLYLMYKSLFSRKISKIRFIGVLLIVIGGTGIILTSPVHTDSQQDTVMIENPESVEGIENVRGYNESEMIEIDGNNQITVVASPSVRFLEVTDGDGDIIHKLRVGQGYVDLGDLSEHDTIKMATIDKNGNTIDKEKIR